MFKKYITLIVTALLFASCTSIRHTADTVAVNPTVVSLTVADMIVSPTRVTRTTSWSYNPFRRVSISTIKSNTEATLLNEAGADVLLEPQYIITRRGFMRGGSVTVIGYPAKLQNFHSMTPEEAEMTKNVRKPEEQPRKRWFFF